MKRLLLTLAVLSATALATVTYRSATFLTGGTLDTLTAAAPACSTNAVNWSDGPYASLSWNAYGESTTVYRVGIQWADATQHFDLRIDTIMVCTLAVGYRTRAGHCRVTETFARQVSKWGRAIFIRDTLSTAGTTVKIDSIRFNLDAVWPVDQ